MNPKLRWLKLGLVSLIGLLPGWTAMAQVPADLQKRYKAAVSQLQRGEYNQAKSELSAIMQRGGPLAPYAHYYWSIAAFRQRDFNQSRLMLKQLMSRFPDWRKIDDAQYLLAAIAMETGQYEEGLTNLQRIGDPGLRADASKLEQYFLSRITDLNRLKQMHREFPENRTIALNLIDLIQRTSTDKDDLELSDRLTNRFGLPATTSAQPATPVANRPNSQATSPATTRPSRPKGYYNVAVMLPFRLDEFDAAKRLRSNQYVFDLYNGIKLAKEKLQEEGITVNLFAYDIENDANKTLELVNSPAFSQTDLIVGPLYAEPNRIASAYANQNNIVLLNPIATSSELIANQPMSFLVQPSLARQAQQVADFIRQPGRPATETGTRRVAIYFGTARKDSLLAASYRDELKRQNYQVVDFQRVAGSAQTMASLMLTANASVAARPSSSSASAPASQPAVSLNHVFLASSNDEDGPKLLDALSRRRVSGSLIATSAAFDYYRNTLSTFTRRSLYLLYPDFIDTSRDNVSNFGADYLASRNTIPSVFASQGYDMMLFFGRQLARNGGQTRNRSTLRSDTDDYLLSGFDYSRSNDNQIVPIVRYEGGRFVKIN